MGKNATDAGITLLKLDNLKSVIS